MYALRLSEELQSKLELHWARGINPLCWEYHMIYLNENFHEGGYTLMRRIKFMIKQFLKEPLWFRILISTTLVASIIFSSSLFSDRAYFQSCSKLAAAIFFCAYGIKIRKSLKNSLILFILAGICIFLSILALYYS